MLRYSGSLLKTYLGNKLPFIVSGFMINSYFKRNFSIARLFEQKFYLKIMNDDDIEELRKNYIKRVEEAENLQIDLRDNKMTNKNFNDFFEIIGKTKKDEIHLDLTSTKIDDEKMNSIVNCLKNLDLKNLSLHISHVDLSNKQFDLMIDTIEKMKNLKLLNLEMENVNLNRYKRNKMESLVNNLPNLDQVSINLRNNNLTEEDASIMSKILKRFEIRHFFI